MIEIFKNNVQQEKEKFIIDDKIAVNPQDGDSEPLKNQTDKAASDNILDKKSEEKINIIIK